MKHKVKIQVVSKTLNKLSFVKLIKECTGLGLKESKDIVDRLELNLGSTEEIEVLNEIHKPISGTGNGLTCLDYLKEVLSGKSKTISLGGTYKINGGLQYLREYKILSLGIGEKLDYHNFISEHIKNNNYDIMEVILSKLSKEDLIEVFNKIEL
jgi:hypothetical protein